MADQIQLEGLTFYEKVAKIVQTWNQLNDTKDALLLVMGKVGDQTARPLTSDFFVWLLNYEFPETILLITKEKIVFAVSPKKKQLLETMEAPMDYKGPELEILVRDTKQDNTAEVIDKVLSHIKVKPAKIGLYLKDQEDGDLSRQLLKAVDAKGFQKVEMKEFMDKVNMTKIQPEIENLRTASSFVKWTFDNVVAEIEDIIEIDQTQKHESIQRKAEAMLEDKKKITKFLSANPKVVPTFLEYPLAILVQSGENFTLNKFNVQSDNNKLNPETIYINVCGKYKDMNVMASRTLLVNPKDDQKKAYQIAFDAMDILTKNLVVGKPIKLAYIAARDFIKEKDANLGGKIHNNFGFGIGCNIKEDSLIINENNETLVKNNMSFHVRITLSDVNKKAARSVIVIGDTVLIDSDGKPQIMTGSIQRKYTEISYSLEVQYYSMITFQQDEEEEKANTKNGVASQDKDDGVQDAKKSTRTSSAKADLITGSRLRSKNFEQHNNEEQRKKRQEQLISTKLEELKKRYENGEIMNTTKKEKVKKMGQIQSYKDEREFPRDVKPGLLYVDKTHDSILVPVTQHSFVPFHVATIKNVSTTQEGQWTYLRLNFHTPGGNILQFPPMDQPNSLFVKELTLKNLTRGGENHLNNAFKQIKDLIKKVKAQEQDDSSKQEQSKQDESLEELITVKGKKEILENLVIRPNIVGKKTVGNLEIHQNGVRFQSQKGHNVDITFSNMKHAFFQPCAEDELIVIIHFHLKNQIMVGNKKVQDVQFFKEAGVAADDLDMKSARKRLNDMDELEQEERERQQKIRLNAKFAAFVKLIEGVSDKTRTKIEFDIPFEDLDFYGCPHKSVVKVRPTKYCLIAISEYPFFVIDIDEIEMVHFERVQFGIKNFDMAIIFKDFTTFKRINSIPIEHIEDIKSYLDEIGIIFSESIVPMNWTNVLQQIREDFEAFLEEGGWKFLQDDDEEGEEDEEDEEDEEFSVASEDDSYSESSASDYDDEDGSSSDFDSEEDLSEEGLSWEEMEKQAEEEDRRAAVRRQGRDVPVQNIKRKPAPSGRRR